MAQSPYSGKTKLFGVEYKNKRIGQCTTAHGDFVCPKCHREDGVDFVDEHCQLGFGEYNKYMEFNHCRECGYRFCIVMVRKDVVYGL